MLLTSCLMSHSEPCSMSACTRLPSPHPVGRSCLHCILPPISKVTILWPSPKQRPWDGNRQHGSTKGPHCCRPAGQRLRPWRGVGLLAAAGFAAAGAAAVCAGAVAAGSGCAEVLAGRLLGLRGGTQGHEWDEEEVGWGTADDTVSPVFVGNALLSGLHTGSY